jgi:hypothetical protein
MDRLLPTSTQVCQIMRPSLAFAHKRRGWKSHQPHGTIGELRVYRTRKCLHLNVGMKQHHLMIPLRMVLHRAQVPCQVQLEAAPTRTKLFHNCLKLPLAVNAGMTRGLQVHRWELHLYCLSHKHSCKRTILRKMNLKYAAVFAQYRSVNLNHHPIALLGNL